MLTYDVGERPCIEPVALTFDVTSVDAVREFVVKLCVTEILFVWMLLVSRLPAVFWMAAEPSKKDVTVGADIVDKTSRVVVAVVPLAVILFVLKKGV